MIASTQKQPSSSVLMIQLPHRYPHKVKDEVGPIHRLTSGRTSSALAAMRCEDSCRCQHVMLIELQLRHRSML